MQNTAKILLFIILGVSFFWCTDDTGDEDGSGNSDSDSDSDSDGDSDEDDDDSDDNEEDDDGNDNNNDSDDRDNNSFNNNNETEEVDTNMQQNSGDRELGYQQNPDTCLTDYNYECVVAPTDCRVLGGTLREDISCTSGLCCQPPGA